MTEHTAVAAAMAISRRNQIVPVREIMSVRQDRSDDQSPGKELIKFNISGQAFTFSASLAHKFPTSRLANYKGLEECWSEDLNSYFFDRDPNLFNAVLNIFRYNVLSVPSGYDKSLVVEEMEYWGVLYKPEPSQADPSEEERLESEFLEMDNRFQPPRPDASSFGKMRYQAWCFITDPYGPHTKYRKLSLAYCLLTVAVVFFYLSLCGVSTSVYYREARESPMEEGFDEQVTDHSSTPGSSNSAAQILSTVPTTFDPLTTASNIGDTTNKLEMDDVVLSLGCQGQARMDCYIKTKPIDWIASLLLVASVIFTFETVIRLALCPGLAYFKSVINWIDILCTLCLFCTLLLGYHMEVSEKRSRTHGLAFQVLQSLQVMRVFKIFQYANVIDGLMVMMLTIRACIKELLLLILYLLMAMFLFATLISFVELDAETGSGIPDALHGYWWAIITMTTVGYGDYYPTTTVGYMIGVMCSITGIIMTALPVAVVGSHFNMYWEHNKKRNMTLMKTLKLEELNAKRINEQNYDKLQIDPVD